MAGMTMAELDAALRAAMDDDWDGMPPAPCHASAESSSASSGKAAHADAAAAPERDTPVPDEATGLDTALRAAMDSDWDGGDGSGQLAPAALLAALPAALPVSAADGASRRPTSMGYLALEGSAAADLMPGATDLSADDAHYILPRLDDGFMLPTLSDAQQREQREEIERALGSARSDSDPAEQ